MTSTQIKYILKKEGIKARYSFKKNRLDCKTEEDLQKAMQVFKYSNISFTYGFY